MDKEILKYQMNAMDRWLDIIFNNRQCMIKSYDEELRETHICRIERGHEGQHECHCGVKWND